MKSKVCIFNQNFQSITLCFFRLPIPARAYKHFKSWPYPGGRLQPRVSLQSDRRIFTFNETKVKPAKKAQLLRWLKGSGGFCEAYCPWCWFFSYHHYLFEVDWLLWCNYVDYALILQSQFLPVCYFAFLLSKLLLANKEAVFSPSCRLTEQCIAMAMSSGQWLPIAQCTLPIAHYLLPINHCPPQEQPVYHASHHLPGSLALGTLSLQACYHLFLKDCVLKRQNK